MVGRNIIYIFFFVLSYFGFFFYDFLKSSFSVSFTYGLFILYFIISHLKAFWKYWVYTLINEINQPQASPFPYSGVGILYSCVNMAQEEFSVFFFLILLETFKKFLLLCTCTLLLFQVYLILKHFPIITWLAANMSVFIVWRNLGKKSQNFRIKKRKLIT